MHVGCVGGWGEGNELYVGYLCVGTSSAQTKFVSAVYTLHRALSLKASPMFPFTFIC